MKKLLFTLAIALGINASASHLLGGMVGVFQTNQDSTTVGVWLISDAQGLPMPNSITVEKWEMGSVGWYVQNGTITLTKAAHSIFQGQTLTNYTSEYLNLDSNKYRFIYKNCCWGVINNSINSFNSEFIISADYWHIPYNSTPAAIIPLIVNQQSGIRNTMKPIWGNINCFFRNLDNGDIVNITQTDLHMGYANGVFVPQNYTQLPMHVDNDSISWVPNSVGNYSTGFKIEDMRNGQVIGVQRIQWTFKVITSTIGIEESELVISYKVYDWYGRYVGDNLNGLKGLYVVKYSNGEIEKIFVN